MMLNRDTALTYQTEISRLRSKIQQNTDKSIKTQIAALAENFQKRHAEEKIDAIPDQVLDKILEYKNISYEQFRKVIEETSFSVLNLETKESKQLDILEKMFQLKNIEQVRNQLLKDHLTLLLSLDDDLNTVVKHDKNAFLAFFQSTKTKENVKKAKAHFLGNYHEVENINKEWESKTSLHQNRNIAISDFKNNHIEYNRFLAELIDYDKTIDDGLTETLGDVYNIFSQKFEDISRDNLENEVKIQWDNYKSASLQNEMYKLPINILKSDSKDNIPYEKLQNEGIYTIGDIQKTEKKNLTTKSRFTEDEIKIISEVTSSFVLDYENNYYPKININKPTESTKTLLKSIFLRKLLNEEIEEYSMEATQILADIEDTFEVVNNENYKNDYFLLFINDEKRDLVNSSIKKVLRLLTQIIEIESKINFDQFIQVSYRQIEDDFIRNSASYYAVIDQITGTNQSGSAHNLPTYIVEAVNRVDLNIKGLKGTLRPYQEFGAKFSLYYERTFLGDEMGLGKTIQAIALANHLSIQGSAHTIIVTPLAVLANWDREIKKWSNLKTYIYRGSDRFSAYEQWEENGGILLMNYEQAVHLFDTSLGVFDCLIIDEAHYIKNPTAKRTKNIAKLADMCKYALFMSGTPLENRLDEMKHLIGVLNKTLAKTISKSYSSYKPEIFKELVSSVYLRRKRNDVLKELPDIESVEMWSSFSEIEQDYYDQAVAMGLPGLMKMRRAAFYGQTPNKSEKLRQLIDICEEAKENGDKIIVFSFFKIVLNAIEKHLNNKSVGMINGSVSVAERQEMIDQFTEAEAGSILLSQIDAGGVGLNIQAANIVIICEPQWKPSTENQAISRVYRMGQTKNVVVYRLLTEESIDEVMLEVLGRKLEIFNDYANDSVVSDAFDQKQPTLSDETAKKKVMEIEIQRLRNKQLAK